MAYGIFEQLAWLTTRVKRLCCAVDKIKESGAGSYKVYTALLTQTGGNENVYVSYNESLIIGVTYLIDNNDGGTADFTNVGAPNNNSGTYFVATGTTPTSWGDNLSAEIFYNAGAPVATVLENTIGNIWFTYGGTGQYYLNFNETFDVTKIYCQGDSRSEDGTGFRVTSLYGGYPNAVLITTTLPVASQQSDDLLSFTPIEIRIYN